MQYVKATIFDKKGNVLSVGYNSYSKTHPLQFKLAVETGNQWKCFLHAEIDAITKLKKKQKEAHLIYIERYLKNGSPALAKPCEVCKLAIDRVNIKQIKFTV